MLWPSLTGSDTGSPRLVNRHAWSDKPQSHANGVTGAIVGTGGSKVFMSPSHFEARESFERCIKPLLTRRRADGEVSGLRLYVENSNQPAQHTYEAMGMKPAGYSVYEIHWRERFQRS